LDLFNIKHYYLTAYFSRQCGETLIETFTGVPFIPIAIGVRVSGIESGNDTGSGKTGSGIFLLRLASGHCNILYNMVRSLGTIEKNDIRMSLLKPS